MYKSRLHTWGLDKKKKEHEMLELVRQGMLSGGESKDKVFMIRGRPVTLAEALHYFNRKGVKNPASLLDQPLEQVLNDLSSPDDPDDVITPLSANDTMLEGISRSDPEFDLGGSPPVRPIKGITSIPLHVRPSDFAERAVFSLQTALGLQEIKPMPAFRTLSVESVIPATTTNPEEQRYIEAILQQLLSHYQDIFASRNLSVNTSPWTATSAETATDKFYYLMYHGYSFLWNGEKERAFEIFNEACAMIEGLIKDNHVAFLIYILDLTIRHAGTEYEGPLNMILQHLADFAKAVYGSESQPTYLIALWLKNATISRAAVAEAVMRKLLDFFQDSIGYFHSETIALLQTFATGLLNNQSYAESAVRFQQLVDAFETTQHKQCYEVCYALRRTSEAYFYNGKYAESLQAIKAVLERSKSLPHLEEREMYVRCLRALAEISGKLNRREEAIDTMRHMLDTTIEAFGEHHTFVSRARMQLKSIQRGESETDGAIPPMVHMLGRGGNASRWVWTTESSPTRLIP